jgi:hypothetical protein
MSHQFHIASAQLGNHLRAKQSFTNHGFVCGALGVFSLLEPASHFDSPSAIKEWTSLPEGPTILTVLFVLLLVCRKEGRWFLRTPEAVALARKRRV